MTNWVNDSERDCRIKFWLNSLSITKSNWPNLVIKSMTFRIWSCTDDLSVILAWNNCLNILYLAVLLYFSYNSLRLWSMDWVSMLSYCLCNSLIIETSMMHLTVKLSFFHILYVDTSSSVRSSPISYGSRTSRI